jgi:hypothetical protein
MSTGAVLGEEIEEVVQITRRAVELVQLPALDPGSPPARWLAGAEAPLGSDVLLGEDLTASELEQRFVLTGEGSHIRALLDANPSARWLIVAGALPEGFLDGLAAAARSRSRSLEVVIGDPTKAFLGGRDLSWYAQQGITLAVLEPIALLAVTVNPVAPQSHTLDSRELRRLLGEAIPGVEIADVLSPDYAAQAAGPPFLK